jgi:hypothetical protein
MRWLPILAVAVVILAACPAPSPSVPTVLSTGTTPNAVAVVRCSDGPRLVVTASAEARLEVLDPAGVAMPRSVFLGAGSTPWDVAVVRHADERDSDLDDDASRVVVTLAGSHGIALVRPCGAPVLLDTVVDEVPLPLPAPVILRQPADIDGDGSDDAVATAMLPKSPQPVVVVPGAVPEVVVAFANILAVSTGSDAPMLTGPALVSRWRLVDGADRDAARLQSIDRLVVPGCENPGGLVVTGPGQVAVACAGRFVLAGAGHGKASDGAVVTLTVGGALAVVARRGGAMTPGPIIAHAGALVVGDLLDGALRRFDPVDLAVLGERPGRDGIDSAFSLVVTDDDALVAGWFDGRLEHDPFGPSPYGIDAPAGPPRGLVDLVDDGERLWGLLTLSAELVALERERP